MDRAQLVLRNRQRAAQLRRAGPKQRLRDQMLALSARLPVSPAQADGERLLIVRPDHLGDVLLSTPAIQALKRSHPALSIHVLCGAWAAATLAGFDEIDRVLTLPFPGFQRASSSAISPWRLAVETGRRLRSIGYGAAIVMRPDHWWGALVAHLAGIPRRVGYNRKNVAPFLTEAVDFTFGHAVEQNLRLVAPWTGDLDPADTSIEFPLQAADRDYASALIESWQIDAGKPIVCIHPGSGAASKLWRAASWAQVGDQLAAEYGAIIVFTGSRSEEALVAESAASMSTEAVRFAGETSVGQLAALYARSRAVLGPDSGALHLAAAVATPTVALFGPADPAEFAPWGDRSLHEVVTSEIGCRPCSILDWRDDDLTFHPCVRDISVQAVLEATRRVLASGRQPQ